MRLVTKGAARRWIGGPHRPMGEHLHTTITWLDDARITRRTQLRRGLNAACGPSTPQTLPSTRLDMGSQR